MIVFISSERAERYKTIGLAKVFNNSGGIDLQCDRQPFSAVAVHRRHRAFYAVAE